MRQEKLWSPEFLGFGLSNSMFFISQYVLVAVLPIVVTSDFKGSAIDAGMAMTYFQIGTLLCRPIAGEIIDSFNKRKVIFISTLLFFLVMALFNVADSMQFLFDLRLLHGAIFALGTTVTAAVAVMVLPKTRKGEGVNVFAVFSNVAMVIGPAIGLLLVTSYGASTTYIFLSIIAGLTFILANKSKLIDEYALPRHKEKKSWTLSRFIELRSLPWAILTIFVGFAYAGVLVFVPIMMNNMGAGGEASYFFGLYALAIIISRPIMGKLFEKKGSDFILYPSLIIFLGGMYLLSQAITPMAILLAAPILGLGYGGVQPAFQALAVTAAPMERAGTSNSTFFLSMDIAVGLGSVILSIIADRFGFNRMYEINTVVVFILLVLYHFIGRPYGKRKGQK